MEGLTISVEHGGGAVSSIPDPRAIPDGDLAWRLRYADPRAVRLIAASVVDSFDHLLSDDIDMAEATRCLRQMRAARRSARADRLATA